MLVPRSPSNLPSRLLAGLAAAALALPLAIAAGAMSLAHGPLAARTGWAGPWPSAGTVAAVTLQRSFAALGAADPTTDERLRNDRFMEMGRFALWSEPTDARALRTLALATSARGGVDRGEAMIMHVDTLTKRDVVANRYLVDQALVAGDVDRALVYFDRMLRVEGEARGGVISVLVHLLADRAAIEPFFRLLLTAPPWQDQFWYYAPRNRVGLDNVVTLRSLVAREGIAVSKDADMLLASALIEERKFASAKRLMAGVAKGDAPASFADGPLRFDATVGAFGWQFLSSAAHDTRVEASSGALEIFAAPEADAVVARRLFEMAPGAYGLTAAPGEMDDAALQRMALRLSCAENDARLFEYGPQAQQRRFNITSDCRWFWLELAIKPGEAEMSALVEPPVVVSIP